MSMIDYYTGKKTTPKKAAQMVARIALNCVNIDAELEDFSLTDRERKEIHHQFDLLITRLYRYL